jgi:tetratricopeptide (TPR) repeat protein
MKNQSIAIIFLCLALSLAHSVSSFAENLADPIIDDKVSRKAEALFEKGHKAFESKNPGAAEKYYRKAIDLEPTEARFHRQLALLLLKERHMPQAEREVRVDLAQDPEDWRGFLVLGSILHVLRRYDEESEAYKKALLVLPNDQASLRVKLEHFVYTDTTARKKEAQVKHLKKELEDEQYKDYY